MGFFNKIFTSNKSKSPEDKFIVTITADYIRVEHPERKTEQVLWNNIVEIKLINTNQGPWLPDVWLGLFGKEDGCLIPMGAKGYNEVYDIVTKYDNFNFENVIKSMGCTDNKEFLLWVKE
ncbi:MAG: hypothetical protein IT249_13210 [Chitinophagaceae bacterium]|nr:hypothetical protein [Chitinophagaceae bacterium]